MKDARGFLALVLALLLSAASASATQEQQAASSRPVVELDHAAGGLVVAETGSNADRRNKEGTGLADPKIIENGEDRVKLFYLADKNRIWHPASMTIDGDKVVLTSPEVKFPRGVSCATGGVGFQPNLYNRALLPATPFIYYDHEPVTSETWPDEKLKVAGVVPDPNTVGKKYEWRKMPLLSTQFRDNAVLQAGVPITVWAAAVHDYGHEAEGEAVIRFRFAGIEKTIPVESDPAIVSLGPGQPVADDARRDTEVDGSGRHRGLRMKLVEERRCGARASELIGVASLWRNRGGFRTTCD